MQIAENSEATHIPSVSLTMMWPLFEQQDRHLDAADVDVIMTRDAQEKPKKGAHQAKKEMTQIEKEKTPA